MGLDRRILWRVALALTACVSLVGMEAATGAGRSARAFDDAEDCQEAVPAAASVAGVLDDGRELVLDVHLLLDGVSEARAQEVMKKAQQAYRPLAITLKWTTQIVDVPAQRREPVSPLSTTNVPTSDADYLTARAKAAVQGRPPGDSDVVYLLTSDNITGTVAGVADCIGGIRYPNRSFAIGEESPDGQRPLPVWCCTMSTAKVAAHEIAHLLGAHHHYANCVEGAPTAVGDMHAGTCTLMFNDVGLVNLHFSAVEAAVVRGHVLRFVDEGDANPPPIGPTPPPSSSPTPSASPSPSSTPAPTPAPPSPTPEPTSEPTSQPSATPSPPAPSPEPTPTTEPVAYTRSVTLDLRRHLVGRGDVDAGSAEGCSDSVPVVVERRTGGKWLAVATTTTAADGTFELRLPDRRGRYRALTPQLDVDDGDDRYTCAIAASAPQRHSHRNG